MPQILVIVESPAKAKIIAKYLNDIDPANKYTVKASLGHVRDLDAKQLGIDIDHGFAQEYKISEPKKKVVNELLKAAASADKILLASDNDREGESIAWHLSELLPKNIAKSRIVFNEITKEALANAIAKPRRVDMALVHAQHARRAIDRLVGYKVTPIIWKYYAGSQLSAGRVQSVALHILVEREKEIRRHVSEPYWQIEGTFEMDSVSVGIGKKRTVTVNGKMSEVFTDINKVQTTLTQIGAAPKFVMVANSLIQKLRNDHPPPPFITTTLQSEGSSKIGMSVSQVMKTAQELYESGHITYMRTDSTVISKEMQEKLLTYISKSYGQQMLSEKTTKTKGKEKEGAHECIRPTSLVPEIAGLVGKARELYSLIFKRTVASQMKPAVYQDRTFEIGTQNAVFHCKVSHIVSPGWLLVYDGKAAQALNINFDKPVICCEGIVGRNTWKSAPSHHNEATLVHKLEVEKVGRPSTYASIIDKLYEKQYVTKTTLSGNEMEVTHLRIECGVKIKTDFIKTEKGKVTINQENSKMVPTEIGFVMDEFMTKHFPRFVQGKFTSDMEEQLDKIAQDESTYVKVLDNFWSTLKEDLDNVKIDKLKVKKGQQEGKELIATASVQYGDSTVKLMRYGPVIETDANVIKGKGKNKDYIGLKAFLSVTKKPYTEITEKEVGFLREMPHTLAGGTELFYGKFGFYMKKGNDNCSVPFSTLRNYKTDITELKSISAQEIGAAFKNKSDAIASKASKASKAPHEKTESKSKIKIKPGQKALNR